MHVYVVGLGDGELMTSPVPSTLDVAHLTITASPQIQTAPVTTVSLDFI